MIKNDRYAKQGMFITNCLEGEICELPCDIAEAFILRNSAIPFIEKQIETTKQPVLETQANKQVLEKKETKNNKKQIKKEVKK